jgi:hypothetical protein
MLSYVGSEVLTAPVMKSSVFWDITQCSPKLRSVWHRIFTLVSCSAYSLTQKMEATCSPKYRLTVNGLEQGCIPEDRTFQNTYVKYIALRVFRNVIPKIYLVHRYM